MNRRKNMLVFCGVIFVAFGLFGMFAPKMLAALLSYKFLTSSAIIDMRATYGGVFALSGGYFLYCATKQELIRLGLHLVIILLGGLLVGRIVGFIFDGSPDFGQYVYLVGEIVIIGSIVVLLKSDKE